MESRSLERLVELDLLGGHRLHLDDLVDTLGANQVEHDAVGLFGITCPVHGRTALGELLLELQQVAVEVGEHLVLHVGTVESQRLPLRHLLDHGRSLGTDRVRGV